MFHGRRKPRPRWRVSPRTTDRTTAIFPVSGRHHGCGNAREFCERGDRWDGAATAYGAVTVRDRKDDRERASAPVDEAVRARRARGTMMPRRRSGSSDVGKRTLVALSAAMTTE